MWAVKKSEDLHFDRILLSKAYKGLDEKIHKSYVSWHRRVMPSLKKTDSWVQKWSKEFGEFGEKVWKFYSDGPFLSKVYEVWAKKKYREVIFHVIEQWCKIWINSDLVVWKMA